MKQIDLNTSIKAHMLLAAVLGLWLVVFLVFIAPFDAEDLSLKVRLILLPPYGFLFFFCYMIGFGVQQGWYRASNSWDVRKEVAVVLVILLSVPIMVYPYYISDWINGEYGLADFLLLQFVPTSLILTPFLVFGRKYLNKLQAKKGQVVLKGENKADVLKLMPNQIIGISSAQNYVEVHFLVGTTPRKKLLRVPLSKLMETDLGLVQVHRSHYVNPDHFIKWKDPKTALFHHLEIPVSKKYKEGFTDSL